MHRIRRTHWRCTTSSGSKATPTRPRCSRCAPSRARPAGSGARSCSRSVRSRRVKTTTSSCCSTTPAAPDPLRIERFEGDRTPLLPLFELADDSRVLLESYLDDGDVLVARDGDDILGHLQLVYTDDADTLEIKNMAVAIARQDSGIGRALVEGALEQARLG